MAVARQKQKLYTYPIDVAMGADRKKIGLQRLRSRIEVVQFDSSDSGKQLKADLN